MRLCELIGEIGAKYDPLLPMSSQAHRLLRQAQDEFQQWIPSEYLAEGCGGNSEPAVTPMIAIFHPAETTTTRHGIYAAYVFAADRSTVTLTLNQGVGEMVVHLGRAGARMVLALQAATIRAALRPADIADLDLTFDLHTTAASSVDYEHANIVSRTYSLDSLPAESEMVADLQRFIQLYALAIEAREVARKQGRHELITSAKPLFDPKIKAQAKPLPEPKVKAQAKPEVKAPAEPLPKPEVKALPEPKVKAPAKPLPQPEVKAPAKALPQPEVKAPAKPLPEPEVKAPAKPVAVEPAPTSKPSSPDEKAPTEPDIPLEALEPDITVGGKVKVTAGRMTRRGILAALVAAPIAYAAPMAVDTTKMRAGLQMPLPAKIPPVFTIDVSQHDWKRRGGNLDWVAIRRAGIAGMCARATYGDPSGYQWPTHHFGSFARAAKQSGMGLRGGYHNLVRGDQPSINRQVDWLRRELDRYDANWAMLDVERYSELVKADMWPTWDDVRRFDDRWAELETRVLVGYIPPWNWSKHLGQPDLSDFRGPLIASNYPRQANEDYKELYEQIGGNDGRGWATYGNRVPEGWQYSSRAKVPGTTDVCDVNAWRINFDQLKALLVGPEQVGRQA